jgi:hypothetical protein
MPSYGKLLEDTRDGILEAVADAIENHQRYKSSIEKATPVGLPVRGAPQGDFLYDFLRLNVQYMNQIARLGSSYSIIASRALEKMYERFMPRDNGRDAPKPEKADPALTGDDPIVNAPPVVLHGRLGERITATFEVKNWLSRTANVRIRCDDSFEAPRNGAPVNFTPIFRYGALKLPGELRLELEANENVELSVILEPKRVDGNPVLQPNGDYKAWIVVEAATSAEDFSACEPPWIRRLIVKLSYRGDGAEPASDEA